MRKLNYSGYRVVGSPPDSGRNILSVDESDIIALYCSLKHTNILIDNRGSHSPCNHTGMNDQARMLDLRQTNRRN